MFIGEYSHTIDEKGRVAVPKPFRTRLEDGAYVTRGLDGCLAVYTRLEWEKLSERVADLPLSRGSARAFQRHLFSGAMEVKIDGQGRVNLPANLRSHAALRGNAVVAGVRDRVEIWDPERWQQYNAEHLESEIADQFDELGI